MHGQKSPQRTKDVHAHEGRLVGGSGDDLLQQVGFRDHFQIGLVLAAQVIREVHVRLNIAEHGADRPARADAGGLLGTVELRVRKAAVAHSRKQLPAHGRLRLFLLCLLVELVLLFSSIACCLTHSVILETTNGVQKEGLFRPLLEERAIEEGRGGQVNRRMKGTVSVGWESALSLHSQKPVRDSI